MGGDYLVVRPEASPEDGVSFTRLETSIDGDQMRPHWQLLGNGPGYVADAPEDSALLSALDSARNVSLVAGLPVDPETLLAWRGTSAEIYRYPTSTTLEHSALGPNPALYLELNEQIVIAEPHGLQVVDFRRSTMRSLSLLDKDAQVEKSNGNFRATLMHPEFIDIKAMADGGRVALLTNDNQVVICELDVEALEARLEDWRHMVAGGGGVLEGPPRDLHIEFDGKKEASGAPKHGKEDDKEHHGGNTWAGGTGGADTAGLGGKGGPYRLDKGNDVYQISEEQKANISEEALQAAREMNREAFAKRIKEIEMSEHQAGAYEQIRNPVVKEIDQLRVILSAVEAKKSERKWLRNQTTGELDDRKLIDGVVGEKAIYRRRGEEDRMPGMHQEKPKSLCFLMDVSGSMYRFNGQDQRLDRLLQTTLMLMESLSGFEHKYEYSIIGHSGDGPNTTFVDYGEAPQNDKDRLQVLSKMYAHTQYCMSGDTTLEALQRVVPEISSRDADDHMVFLVSDANLRRYGITTRELAEAMTPQGTKAAVHCIFIASFGDEAVRLQQELPLGKGHVCLDPTRLPPTLKQIFADSMMRNMV